MKNVLLMLLLATTATATATAASAESVRVQVAGQPWAFDLAKACQTEAVRWAVLDGAETTTQAIDGRLIVGGKDTGIACPTKIVKKRRGGGGGGSTGFVDNSNGLVDAAGDVVLNEGEVMEDDGDPIETPETTTEPEPVDPGEPATEAGNEQPPMG